jgi:Fe-S-cluster containining protein
MLYVGDSSYVQDITKPGSVYAGCQCVRCGDCCRAIAFCVSLEQIQQDDNFPDREFILKHWRPVKAPDKKMNPEMSDSVFRNFQWFVCDLFDGTTNLCADYQNRPDFCRRYPTEFHKPCDLISAKCGFLEGVEK